MNIRAQKSKAGFARNQFISYLAIPQKSPQRVLQKETSHGKRFFCQIYDFHRSACHENLSIIMPTVIGVVALSQPLTDEFNQEHWLVKNHRDRFNLHTRSVKQTEKQLDKLKARWMELPRDG